MVTRVIGIPDSHGIIRVSCGTDMIEIVITPVAPSSVPGPTPSGGFNPTPLDPNPFDQPFARILRDLVMYRISLSDSVMRVGRADDGTVDAPRVIDALHQQIADPSTPGPHAVVLSANHADLHEIGELARQIAEAVPHIPLAIDFREP